VVAGDVVVSGSISGRNITVAVGALHIGAQIVSVSNSATQTGGTLRLGGGAFRVADGLGRLVMDDGTLTGTGTLDAQLEAQGNIAPGSTIGTLNVSRATTFGTDARLTIEVGGTGAGNTDLLAIASTAALGGSLSIGLVNGFTPAPNDTFTILTAASGISGFFLNAPLDGSRFDTAEGAGSFVIDYTPSSVVLTQYIPEPSAVMLAISAGALIGIRRRRILVLR